MESTYYSNHCSHKKTLSLTTLFSVLPLWAFFFNSVSTLDFCVLAKSIFNKNSCWVSLVRILQPLISDHPDLFLWKSLLNSLARIIPSLVSLSNNFPFSDLHTHSPCSLAINLPFVFVVFGAESDLSPLMQ